MPKKRKKDDLTHAFNPSIIYSITLLCKMSHLDLFLVNNK